MELILKYFPKLTTLQKEQFQKLEELYSFWNERINVISRKDISHLYLHHVLHSLSIAKVVEFKKGTDILDIGTGGGFPGMPLAILFPETHFHLVDSIGKKIKVVREVAGSLQLGNVSSEHARAEQVKGKYDFIISRAVTDLKTLSNWSKGKIKPESVHDLKNGLLVLKGGDITEELIAFPKAKVFNIHDFFEDDYFQQKVIIYLPS